MHHSQDIHGTFSEYSNIQCSRNIILGIFPGISQGTFPDIPGIYHGNVPQIFHDHIFSRWEDPKFLFSCVGTMAPPAAKMLFTLLFPFCKKANVIKSKTYYNISLLYSFAKIKYIFLLTLLERLSKNLNKQNSWKIQEKKIERPKTTLAHRQPIKVFYQKRDHHVNDLIFGKVAAFQLENLLKITPLHEFSRTLMRNYRKLFFR